ncbi:unnamed protein product [Linum trigynum]|uniref:Uncharacterized protein n=1 Tax=Linum trigynum TaxID=586398 RepID=A0AAV2GRR5_9ROSI
MPLPLTLLSNTDLSFGAGPCRPLASGFLFCRCPSRRLVVADVGQEDDAHRTSNTLKQAPPSLISTIGAHHGAQ